MKIGVFDSGIGGLTVLKRLIERHPNHHYIYYGDSLNLPYGTKTKEELLLLARANIEFLISKGAEAIVVACGTVSSNIDSDFKKQFNVPIIDIIEPTVRYINNSDFNSIGVIATNMTINSKAFVKNINDSISVVDVACPKFVPLIEDSQFGTLELREAIDEYLGSMRNVDAILLGCTHYPLLKDDILNYLSKKIELIDVGYIIASDFNFPLSDYSKTDVYFSKMSDKILSNTCKILGNFQIKGV